MLFAVIAPLEVFAQNTNLGVSILQITPKEASGQVGTNVNVQGTIYISNGTYQLILNKQVVVASGRADGFYVNANFTVPEMPAGLYPLTLRDVGQNLNSTAEGFTVLTGYSITASSGTVQEGSSVSLTASVTGAQSGTSYYAKISVVLPSSGTTYTKTLLLSAPNAKGTASAQATFPDSSFDPAGSTTNYPGAYAYSFNSSLASGVFNVNILDQTSYHRSQTVSIRATGYEANQAATITVTSVKTGTVLDTFSATASSDGVITSSYVVSSTADIGDYTVKITPTGTQKPIPDSQTFSVSGYAVQVQTTNLAGESVPGISVQATDVITNTVYNAISDDNGIAAFKFEKGPVGLTAFWNGVNVGVTNITVSGEGSFQLKCQLTNLKITVRNSAGVAMPFVNLEIQFNYQTTVTKTGSAQGQTGPSGSYTLKSALAGATYKIDASVYNQIFNAANNTFSNLGSQPTTEVTIICPNEPITFNVIGYNQAPITNARIEMVEISNGLFYSSTTDGNGSASAQVTFGTYRVRVFKDNALINETPSLQVFSATQKQITATLYGIQLQVKVVDALGAAISNAEVTLNGPQTLSAITKGDGIATFDNIVGGNMQIITQAQGSPDAYQAITTVVNGPGTVQVKMDKYIALGSMLLPASFLLTLAIIIAAVLTLIVVEVARRRRVTHKGTS